MKEQPVRKKTDHINMLVGGKLKEAIRASASERNTTITNFLLRGAVKEDPKLAQAVLEDR